MGFGFGGIAKKLSTTAGNILKKGRKYHPGYQVVKYVAGGIRKKRRTAKSYKTADYTLAQRKAMERPRKVGRGKGRKRLSPGLSMRKKRGGKGFKGKGTTRTRARKGLKRFTGGRGVRPKVRGGTTGRKYSGTPMNRAAITAAVAAAMKRRKKK